MLVELCVGDVWVVDDVVVGLGLVTPVDWGRLTAPAWISTMLLLVVFSTAGAIQTWLFVRS